MKAGLLVAVVAAGCSAFAADRVDSTCFLKTAWDPRTWSSPGIWEGYQYAQEGGIATFAMDGSPYDRGDSENTFKQDVDGLTLKGLELKKFYAKWFGGKDITFSGASPWVSSWRTDSNARLLMTLKGEVTNVLSKVSGGKLSLGAAPKNFAAVDVVQGTLAVTDTTGADTLCANGVPVKVSNGTLSVEPASSGGSTKIGTLRNASGFGAVSVAKETLTVDSMPKDEGAILAVSTSGGGKFLVTGKTSETAPDGGLVALSGNDISFLDYDATDGWKPGSSVPANARVFGSSSDAGTTNETGALTFSGEGYVWRPAAANINYLKVTGPISAPGGVTFASAAMTGTRPTVILAGDDPLDGKLRFAGVRVSPEGLTPARLASTADLSVCLSGVSDGCVGGLLFDAQQHHGEPFDCTLRFFGRNDRIYALDAEGFSWQCKSLVLQGVTEFDGEAMIGSDVSKGTICFDGPIIGRGGFLLKAGNARLANPGNTFAGDLRATGGAVVIVHGSGVLGSGDVTLQEQSMMYFSDLTAPRAVGNRFLGTAGWLAVQNAQVALAQPMTRSGCFVQDGSTLTLGGDCKAGQMTVDLSSTVAADDRDVTLTAGESSGIRFVSGALKDGTEGGKLSLRKVGTDTLVVCATNSTYSGRTEICEGTLRLGGSLFSTPDLVFWGDASDASTMTVADGKVTEWRSKVGDYRFGQSDITSASFPDLVTGDQTYNGHTFLRFTPGMSGIATAAPYPSLRGSGEIEVRTIVLVVRSNNAPGTTANNAALVGYGLADVSLRVTQGGWIQVGYESSATLATAPFGYQNGARVEGKLDTRAIAGANLAVVTTPRHVLSGSGYNHFSKLVMQLSQPHTISCVRPV